jgi:hypothetical protein
MPHTTPALSRAVETISGTPMRIEPSEGRDILAIHACTNTLDDDDCLSMQHPMAWSSPIFVSHEEPDE